MIVLNFMLQSNIQLYINVHLMGLVHCIIDEFNAVLQFSGRYLIKAGKPKM